MIDTLEHAISILKSGKCNYKDIKMIMRQLQAINVHSRDLKLAMSNNNYIPRAIKDLEKIKERAGRIYRLYAGRYNKADIQEGNIRNTVLNDTKELEKILKDLEQSHAIKNKEIVEFRTINPMKSKKLVVQVKILKDAIISLKKTIDIIKKYKNTNVA